MSTIRGRQLSAHFAVTRDSNGNLVFEEYSTATTWITDTDKTGTLYPPTKNASVVWAGTATENSYLAPPSSTWNDWASNVEKTDLDYLTNGGNFAIGFAVSKQTSSNQVFNRYFDNVLLVNVVNTGSFVISLEANNNTTTQSSVTIVATPGTLQTGTNQGVPAGDPVYRWIYDYNIINRSTLTNIASEWPGPIIAPVYESEYVLPGPSYVAANYIASSYFVEESGSWCISELENGVSYTVDPLQYVLGPFYFPDAELVPPVTLLGQTTATTRASMAPVLAGFAITSGSVDFQAESISTATGGLVRSGHASLASTSTFEILAVKINQTHQGTATAITQVSQSVSAEVTASFITQTLSITAQVQALATTTAQGQTAIAASSTASIEGTHQMGGTAIMQAESLQTATAANLIDHGVTYASVGYAQANYFEELVDSQYFLDQYVETGYLEDILVQIHHRSTSSISVEPSVELIIAANIQATSLIQGQPGYLVAMPSLTVGSTSTQIINYTAVQGGPGVIIASTLVQTQAQSTSTQTASVIHGSASAIASGLTSTQAAGVIYRPSAEFSSTSQAASTPKLTLGGQSSMILAANWPATLAGYGLFAEALLAANSFELSAGKIVILDDYYLLLVPPETRLITITGEPRTIQVDPERAVAQVITEPRTGRVLPETAVYRIPVAVATQIGNRTRRIEQ